MPTVQETVEALQRLRSPFDLSFRHGGDALAVALLPGAREAEKSFESRIWQVTTAGEATQLTFGPGSDAVPRFSPADGRLAFASDRITAGRMSLFLLGQDGEASPLGEVPGSLEEALWTSDGSALIVLSADRGLDCAATDGAVRLWWGDEPDPDVVRPDAARRRLFRVAAGDGGAVEVGPEQLTVWAFDLIDEGRAVALVSEDASERGWYRAHLALLDLRERSARTLHEPNWQLQSPAADPSGRRVAVVEGWASDRGLVAGEIRVVDLSSGDSTLVAAEAHTDVSFVQWRDPESLWFAGWSDMGTAYGVVRLDGTLEWSEREDAVVGLSSFFAQVTPAPDGSGLAAVREAVGQATEVVYRAERESPWRPLSAFNDGPAADLPSYPEVREVAWRGPDDLPIRGLLLLPRDRPAGPSALVVDVHGGPTWSSKHAFDPGYAMPLVAAGYAVLLPNYRGSVGRGQEFTRRNVRDPGGAEFQDILRGVDWCVDQGIADAARVGITGVSYGGYMTAWAVATSDRFRAAVMISGISNLLSCHYACNHAFCEFIVGGPHTEAEAQRLFVERSPLIHVAGASTPTLILHGTEDRCTPLGQAEEFYRALADQGVETEIVIYPREGHGFQERAHQLDAWQRSVAWFDQHLQGQV
jgi:dipeptidyl aminopeptidase/acylaminoacyl peptidase